MRLPSTTRRVLEHSSEWNTEKLERGTLNRLLYFADHPSEIEGRLYELDREWDIERMLETNAASFALIGIGLGVTVDRKWFALPAIVMGFFLQHALQGWCPPLPVMRRLGMRTQGEIEMERYALKALRGDFGDLGIKKGKKQGDPIFVTRVFQATKKYSDS
ncbi:MAG: hypothetical protein ACYDHW_00360 [Syntrophorhabdaceae bacterium]